MDAGPRVVCLEGGIKSFGGGCKNILVVEDQTKKRLLSQMHPSSVGPVAFFWGTIFAWDTKTSFGTDFAVTFGDEDQKQKKVFIANAPQWRRSCCFLLGHNFCLEGVFSLGIQKLPLVQILPSHLGVKTKNKKKGFYRKRIPVASVLLLSFGAQFSLGGHISHLGGGTNSKLGAWPQHDSRGTWPAWMVLFEIYCIGFVV